MVNLLAVVGVLGVFALGAGIGYWAGRRHTLATQLAQAERTARIMGEPFRGAEPHNYGATPSRVTQGRMRSRRTFKLHD